MAIVIVMVMVRLGIYLVKFLPVECTMHYRQLGIFTRWPRDGLAERTTDPHAVCRPVGS